MAENLPFWFSEEQVAKLQAAGENWFSLLRSWASWPLAQMDPESCEESVLGLLAWQRDIDRFSGEGLSLFRKRIKYAYANARDAGSAAGFKRIFQRLGVGEIEQEERMPGRDWDIVAILLSDEQLSGNQPLLDVIIRQYGRTCRRYEWKVVNKVPVRLSAHEFNNDYVTEHATL